MKNILGSKEGPILDRFLRPGTLLAFDFDGTLAPIVRDPEAASMRAKTRQLLERLARQYPCAVISGRARKDVLAKVKGIALRAVFGNHGIEPARQPRKLRALVRGWRTLLERALPRTPGLVLEDKGVSLAVHYRQASHRVKVRRQVLDATLGLPDKRIILGKMVVNVLPADADDKASALTTLRRRLRCPLAVYLGDDDNDEDAFGLAEQGWLLGIRVGRSLKSQAQYFLPGQAAVDALLSRMLLPSLTSSGRCTARRR